MAAFATLLWHGPFVALMKVQSTVGSPCLSSEARGPWCGCLIRFSWFLVCSASGDCMKESVYYG